MYTAFVVSHFSHVLCNLAGRKGPKFQGTESICLFPEGMFKLKEEKKTS